MKRYGNTQAELERALAAGHSSPQEWDDAQLWWSSWAMASTWRCTMEHLLAVPVAERMGLRLGQDRHPPFEEDVARLEKREGVEYLSWRLSPIGSCA